MSEHLIEIQGIRSGPFSAEELAYMRARGRLPDDTKVIYPYEGWDAATVLSESPLLLAEMATFKTPGRITSVKALKAYVVILFGILTLVWSFICPRYMMIDSRYLVPSDSDRYYSVLDLGKFIAGELFMAAILSGVFMLYIEEVVNKQIERWNLIKMEPNQALEPTTMAVTPPASQEPRQP